MRTITASAVAKSFPIFSVLLIGFGLLKAYCYYAYFGIRIVAFLDLSEVLLMFVDDIALLTLGSLIMVALIEWYGRDKLYSRIYERKGRYNIKEILFEIAPFLLSGALVIISPNRSGAYQAILMAGALLAFYLITWIRRMLSERLNIDQSVNVILSIVIMMGILMCVFGFRKGILLDYSKVRDRGSISLKSGRTIVANDTLLILGKTKNFLFLYDRFSKVKTIIPMEDVQQIEIK
jgi:hypothetical protein